MEVLKGIKRVTYKGPKDKELFTFKQYNAGEIILGKRMSEHLKFALSWWHTACAEGSDPFGKGTIDKSFGATEPLEVFKRKADFCFELMDKLGIEYYCFHDADIAPEGSSLKESLENLSVMTGYLKEKQKEYGKKLLWGTANNFSNRMFMSGAATSPNPDVFAAAAAKVKACIDATLELSGSGYVFWGGREGYDTMLNTDVGLELDNLANFLRMARDYGRKSGFKGDFYIEPKPKEPTKHQYDFDAAACIGFLRKYGLIEDFKLNIEANHATLAGHTFSHELRTAAINGAFGSIDANQGDMLLGWDTDHFPADVYEATYCMLEVLRAGGFKSGGLNFDAKASRASNTFEDIVLSYILGMDTFALGLRLAARIIEDGRIDNFVKERYSGYSKGIGKKIAEGKATLEELSIYALSLGQIEVNSGKQEHLESIINNIIFS